jgi:hypothetical protein
MSEHFPPTKKKYPKICSECKVKKPENGWTPETYIDPKSTVCRRCTIIKKKQIGKNKTTVSQHSPIRRKRPKIRLIFEDEAVFNRNKKMAKQLTALDFRRVEIAGDSKWKVPAYIHYEIELSKLKRSLDLLGVGPVYQESKKRGWKNEELWVSTVYRRFFELHENKAFYQEIFRKKPDKFFSGFALGNEDLSFEIEICSYAYLKAMGKKWNKLQQSNASQDPSYYFWVLDSDGLELSLNNLNHANTITVNPLKPFFETQLSRKPNRNNLWGALTHEFQQSFQHYILIIHPNAEVFSYTFTNDSRTKLIEKLSEQDDEYAMNLFRPSLLGVGKLPFVSLNEGRFGSLKEKFLDNKSLSPEGILFISFLESEFKTYFKSDSGFRNFDFLSGSCYLGKIKQKLPLVELKTIQSLEFIESQFSLFKWKVEKQEADSSKFVTSWSNPRFCSSRTKIRMVDLRQEKQELYGNGLDGFKPCELQTGGASRCYQHR